MDNGSFLTKIIHFNTIFLLKYNQMLISKDVICKLKDQFAGQHIVHRIIIVLFKDKILIRILIISIGW